MFARFPDGIHYLSLGQAASAQTALQEIARVMRLTSANACAAPAENSTSLREAMDYAFWWFQRKQCLFLIDDMWPTDDCKTGLLQCVKPAAESRFGDIPDLNIDRALKMAKVRIEWRSLRPSKLCKPHKGGMQNRI